jgi:hypothetical protein
MKRTVLRLSAIGALLATTGCCHHHHRPAPVAPACPPAGTFGPAPPGTFAPQPGPVGPGMPPHRGFYRPTSAGFIDPYVQLHEYYQTVNSQLHTVPVH